jgi:hypothetical protein
MVNADQSPEIPMRALTPVALCGLVLGVFVFGAASSAEAQDRRMVINVKPRSWLDSGKVVPVGSMQNYIYDVQGAGDINRFGSRSNNWGLLPDRFASGRGFMFETPIFGR